MKKQTVYKKDALEFVIRLQTKAIIAITAKHNELIEQRKAELFTESGFEDKLALLQSQFNRIMEEQIKLGNEMKNSLFGYQNSLYGGPERETRDFGGTGLVGWMKEHCELSDAKLTALKKRKDKEITEVKAEYRNLHGLCSKQDNGEKVGKILTDLGFDISAICKGEEEKALSLNIDKSKLFVCGDNK